MSRPVKHIVLVRFKADAVPAKIAELFEKLHGLQSLIPGIRDLSSGPNSSPEGLSQGYTHAFVLTFDNAAARDAYLPHPSHQVVVALIVPLLESVAVVDYEFEG